MKRLLLFAAAVALATPAAAETRYYSFDPADRLTRSLTNGLTFQVDRGLFGGIRVQRLYSTTAQGSAELRPGGPDGVRRALPAGSTETSVYAITPEGDGRGLTRALCPGSDEAWLVFGRLRPARPLSARAVGRWTDGTFRHCAALSYNFRGEWALPAGATVGGGDAPGTPIR